MKPKIKTIDSLWVFLIATAVLGPFALPLLWRNPRWSKVTKTVGTLFILALTLGLIYTTYLLKDLIPELETQ